VFAKSAGSLRHRWAADKIYHLRYKKIVEKNMSRETLKKSMPSENMIVSFCDSPSKATIRDFERDQFVLLSTRKGSVGTFLLEVAEDILSKVHKLQNAHIKLRGIWFDNLHGDITSYIELLHDYSKDDLDLTKELILKTFENGWYDGQHASAEVTLTPVSITSEHFFPLNDEFYGKFKEYLFW